jgi:hypothetical protein
VDKKHIFLTLWIMTSSELQGCLPGEELRPVPEFKFDANRGWRFDWAFPKQQVAVEVDGGLWAGKRGGGHNSPSGYQDDCYKLNRATESGWQVFRFTIPMLTDDGYTCCQQVWNTIINRVNI